MISVDPTDWDDLNFLWTENPFGDEIKPVTMRFTRVVFGVSSSLYFAECYSEASFRNSEPGLVKTLNRSIYIDNVTGAD